MAAAHNNDGSLKDSAVSAHHLDAGTPGTGQYLAYNGTKLSWTPPPVDDPLVGGDLSGTASNAQIATGAVGTDELADGGVTSAKLAAGAVLQDNISTSNSAASGQVLTYDGTALTWATVATSGGTGGDPAMGGDLAGTASNAQLVAGSVDTTELADGSVTNSKLAAGAVDSTKLANGAVLKDNIGTSNIAASNQVLSYDGSNLAWITPAAAPVIPAVIDCYTYTFGQTVAAAGTARMYVEYNSTVSKIRVSAGSAVAGQSVIVDINKNGTTIFTTQANRPTIAVGGVTQLAAAPDVTAFAAGDYITVDADQLGNVSGSYGVPLTISIYLQRS